MAVNVLIVSAKKKRMRRLSNIFHNDHIYLFDVVEASIKDAIFVAKEKSPGLIVFDLDEEKKMATLEFLKECFPKVKAIVIVPNDAGERGIILEAAKCGVEIFLIEEEYSPQDLIDCVVELEKEITKR